MIRPAAPDELGFIRETCCKVRRPRGESWSAWEAQHGPLVDRWLREGKALVWCDETAPDLVLGFLLATGDVLRMLYVKRDFRGEGIGLELLGALSGKPRIYHPNAVWKQWTAYHRRVLGDLELAA